MAKQKQNTKDSIQTKKRTKKIQELEEAVEQEVVKTQAIENEIDTAINELQEIHLVELEDNATEIEGINVEFDNEQETEKEAQTEPKNEEKPKKNHFFGRLFGCVWNGATYEN